MVTKQLKCFLKVLFCYVLAKIHMVTKLCFVEPPVASGYVLAKIHMVTKPKVCDALTNIGYVLAKIHMVTKHSEVSE